MLSSFGWKLVRLQQLTFIVELVNEKSALLVIVSCARLGCVKQVFNPSTHNALAELFTAADYYKKVTGIRDMDARNELMMRCAMQRSFEPINGGQDW